jgi:phage tail-like protein
MIPREVRSAFLGLMIVLGTFVPATITTGAFTDPPDTIARMSIVIDDVEIASFSELVLIRSGNDDVLEIGAARLLLPRNRTLPTVVLRRGHTSDLGLWSWHLAALQGAAGARKSCSLVMYDTEGAPVARYYLENAWPAKLEIGSLKAGASEVLMETVSFVAERITRVSI